MQEFQVEVEFFDLWKIIFFSIFSQTEFFNRSEKWFNAFELEVEKIIRERERELQIPFATSAHERKS